MFYWHHRLSYRSYTSITSKYGILTKLESPFCLLCDERLDKMKTSLLSACAIQLPVKCPNVICISVFECRRVPADDGMLILGAFAAQVKSHSGHRCAEHTFCSSVEAALRRYHGYRYPALRVTVPPADV